MWVSAAGLLLLAVAAGDLVRQSHPFMTVGFLAVAVCSVGLVQGLVLVPQNALTRLLGTSVFSWPGRNLSYGLYLWHIPLLAIVPAVLLVERHLSAALAVPPVIVLAYLSWRLVERPINAWRRRAIPDSPPAVKMAVSP